MYYILRKIKFSGTDFRDFYFINWKKPGCIILVCFLLFIFPMKHVFGCSPPTANFSVDNTAPCVGQTITFTDTSDPGDAPITVWSWNFGSGANPPTATGQGPWSVSYLAAPSSITAMSPARITTHG